MNYCIILFSILLIVAGFLLMSGPACTQEQFEPDVFSIRRTVVAPTVCFFGYLFIIVGILWPKCK